MNYRESSNRKSGSGSKKPRRSRGSRVRIQTGTGRLLIFEIVVQNPEQLLFEMEKVKAELKDFNTNNDQFNSEQ